MYEVRSRIRTKHNFLGFMDVEYFDTREEAEAKAKESFKRNEVDYVTVTKITKIKTKVIRSLIK